MKNQIIAPLILCGLLISIPVSMINNYNKKEEKKYKELPFTTGTVVEKIDINTQNPKTMFLIDTDDNKDTIEKEMIIRKDSLENIAISNTISEGSKIKFKDKFEDSSFLRLKDIYQINDFAVKQR